MYGAVYTGREYTGWKIEGASKESAVMLCNRRSRDMHCMAYFT